MTYPRAYKGVGKIHTAEILYLIAACLSLVVSIMSAIGGNALVAGGYIVIGASVLMIISAFINISGVSTASQDEPEFKKALYALIVGFACNLGIVYFSSIDSLSFMSSICNFIGTFSQFLATFFICSAIIKLAGILNDPNVMQKAKTARTILMVALLISAILSLLSAIFGNNAGLLIIISIISVISTVLTIISLIFYVIMLSKAKAMLER